MKTLLEELLKKQDIPTKDKFYRHFSSLNYESNEDVVLEVLPTLYKLFNKNILSKNILYLSLLLNDNSSLLDACIQWEKVNFKLDYNDCLKDSNKLFDYTIYTKKHWFYHLISNWETINETLPNIQDKLLYLQLVTITNESNSLMFSMLEDVTKKCLQVPSSDLDPFWIFYAKEIRLILKILELCQNQDNFISIHPGEFMDYSTKHSVLSVCSEYLNLTKTYKEVEHLLTEINQNTPPHNENLSDQIQTLSSFGVLANLLKLILPSLKDNQPHPSANEEIKRIQSQFLQLKDHKLQIELLQLIFTITFLQFDHIIKRTESTFKIVQSYNFICNEKEVRLILFTLKSLIENIEFNKIFENDPHCSEKLDRLHTLVIDATRRLDIVINTVSLPKYEEKFLYYMLATPEGLINLCLKNDDFDRAYQVLKIFNLTSTPEVAQIVLIEDLDELKEKLKRSIKCREAQQDTEPNFQIKYDEIIEEFFQQNPLVSNPEWDQLISEHCYTYPFLEHYKSENELFMNILDLALTQTETCDDSRTLLQLALKHNTLTIETESNLSHFIKKVLDLFNYVGATNNLSLPTLLLNCDFTLDTDQLRRENVFYEQLNDLYTEFWKSLDVEEPEGSLNEDHLSHKIYQDLNEHCSNYLDGDMEVRQYLPKLFNYLKAFSKVLYIENDSSELITEGKNCAYFKLLFFNRSELMGQLLFKKHLEPAEFEKYFSNLKLDFLYHVAGNCFPTINLHSQDNIAREELYPENLLYPPNQAVILYIKKRNWLLALLLMEMHKVENVDMEIGESRIQNFINYLRLPKIQYLMPLFHSNEIVTALQHQINFQQLNDFVFNDIQKNGGCLSSTHTSHSGHSLETAKEIGEDELKTTNWKKLYKIIESVPEKQFVKQPEFLALRDMILCSLVRDAYECEYYKYVMKIKNKDLRISLVLDNMKIWPVEFCMRCINSELSRFDQDESDERLAELKEWLKYFEHCNESMEVLGITTWSSFYEMIAFHPKELMRRFVMNKKVDLLLEFLEINEVNNSIFYCIDEDFLEVAFEVPVDPVHFTLLLKSMSEQHSLALCKNLLTILKDVGHLQFVVDYLIELSPPDMQDHLPKIALSLKLLSVLSQSDFDQKLLCLLKDPLSIIEVLLMNTKLDKLGLVLDTFKSNIDICQCKDVELTVQTIDKLLRRYAEKSLDFRVITQPNPRLLRTPEHKLLQSLDSDLDPETRTFVMPDDIPDRDQWVSNTDVIECMCCRNVIFSMFNRRHHCRRCGRVICSNCSKNRMIVPTYGDIMVRVCSDCYNQSVLDLSEGASSIVLYDDYWVLTDDEEHNKIVREEFSYEFAPSVSLCLSLLKFHSKCEEYPEFLLEQCDLLLKLLIPSQEPLQEIDYMLVIRMLKSLALAAKMAAQDTTLLMGSSTADRFLSQAELLGLLAERGCLNLLPLSSNTTYIDSISLMKLIDKLLEREQWNLALEVSTKAGIDKSGVFAAWGMSCLKAGNLATAREKFIYCMDKHAFRDNTSYEVDSSSVKGTKNPLFLNELIKILECKNEALDEALVRDQQKFLSSMTANQSVVSGPQSESAIFILNKLQRLNDIENGVYTKNPKRDVGKKTKPVLEDVIYNECVYYLNKYGTGLNLVEFHLKYGQYKKVVESILLKQITPEMFVQIYVKCLKQGTVTALQTHMSEIDPTLAVWKDFLMKVCGHLENHHFLNSLYQLQLFMGDYVRAAILCVKFYKDKAATFKDLLKKNDHLKESLRHLKQAREQEQWVAVSPVKTSGSEETFEETSISSPLVIKMSQSEIDKHTGTILLQLKVTEFLASCENNDVFPMQVFSEIYSNLENVRNHKVPIPTLLDSEVERKYVAVLCLTCSKNISEGFDYALRIINQFKQLRPMNVYKDVSRYLASKGKFGDLTEFVNCIKTSTTTTGQSVNDICDEILILAVATLGNSVSAETNVERLIKLIVSKQAQVCAYIEAKQLMTAYFLAAKHKLVAELKHILREAELTNQVKIKILCQKAIQKCSGTS